MPSCRRRPAMRSAAPAPSAHVERVLVAHVDDRPCRSRCGWSSAPDGRHQRKKAKRAGERSDGPGNRPRPPPKLFGGRRPSRWIAGARRRPSGSAICGEGRPMPEGEESDFLHAGNLLLPVAVCDPRCAGWWSAFCSGVRPMGPHHCSLTHVRGTLKIKYGRFSADHSQPLVAQGN